ncbi:MAG TPA: hypothetical protein VLI04_05900 [Nocardioidaceae bacterium]|nr:hypothetical protein [Nocardioidaceae bacterium]
MKDRLRNLAEATGLRDVWDLRRRVASMEDGLEEHYALQERLAEQVTELEQTLARLGRRP